MACQIGDWVDLQSLKQHAFAVSHDRIQSIKLETIDRPLSTAIITPHLHKEQKKKQAAIEAIQSLVKKRARSESVSLFNELPRLDSIADREEPLPKLPSSDSCAVPQVHTTEAVPPHAQIPVVSTEKLPDEPQQSAEALFDNIRVQYFEALYKSMVGSIITSISVHG
jgi:hypothetical protein